MGASADQKGVYALKAGWLRTKGRGSAEGRLPDNV